MMTMSEWELFVAETGIEVGDTVNILESGGKYLRAIYLGPKGRFFVQFKDQNGKDRKFRSSDLVEVKGNGTIMGLSKVPLSLKKL